MQITSYNQAPLGSTFQELRDKAIELWQTYDNAYGYVDEKVNQIKDLANYKDNFMLIVSMFNSSNQIRLAKMLSPETRLAIRERMISGGYPSYLIFF